MYSTQLIYTKEVIKYFKDGVEVTPKTYNEKSNNVKSRQKIK